MKPAYQHTSNAPVRRYLLIELARFGLSGRQWDVVAIIMDDTYGWADKRRGKGGRKDRNRFRYDDMAAKIGCSYDSVSRAMRELMQANIVHEYLPPSRSQPGTYGIVSDPSQWIRKPSDRSAKTATNGSELVGNSAYNIRQKPRPIPAKTATNVSEKPDNHAPGSSPNHNINQRSNLNPKVPRGDDGSNSFFEIARKAYLEQTGDDITRSEERSLQTFFELSPYKSSLLKLWLEAIPAAIEDRELRLDDPDRAPYVSARAYKDVRRIAGALYRKVKAAQQDRPKRLAAA